MEFWATEVKSGETIKVEPGEEKRVHLTQANLGEVKNGKSTESVQLFVNVDVKKLVLGTLISENLPNMRFDLAFDQDFELSHNWKDGSVYFFGYKVDNGDLYDDPLEYDSSEDDIPLRPVTTVKDEKLADKKVITETANGLHNSDDDDSTDSSDEGSGSESDDESSDENEDESGSDSEDESVDGSEESEEDEPAKVEPGKKRASDSEPETPASKKKVKMTTPEKTETDGKKESGSVHVDTPHPSKKSGKTSAATTPNQKTKKSGGTK